MHFFEKFGFTAQCFNPWLMDHEVKSGFFTNKIYMLNAQRWIKRTIWFFYNLKKCQVNAPLIMVYNFGKIFQMVVVNPTVGEEGLGYKLKQPTIFGTTIVGGSFS